MFFLKSKKGQATEMSLAHIIDIGMAVLAIIILVSFVYKSSSGEFVDEKRIALNIGLLMDTLTSSNGNTLISTDIYDKPLIIVGDKVKVGKKWTQSFHLLGGKYSKTTSDISFYNVTEIAFLKSGNRLYVSQELNLIESHHCPFVLFEKPLNSIILPATDPTTGINSFTFNLKKALNDQGIITKTMDNLTENTELLIKIVTTNTSLIEAKIPKNSAKSRRLACSIINEIKRNNQLNSRISIVENKLFKNSTNSIILTISEPLRSHDTIQLLSDTLESIFT